MLQQGLGRSAEQNPGLGGDIRLKSSPYLLPFLLLHGGRPGSGRPSTILDINLLRTSVCSIYHVLRKCTRGDRAAYLHRARPGRIGHRRYLKGYDCGPNSIVRNNEEQSWAPRRFPLYRATWPTSPPRSIALSHRITYVPCRAAMAPWLLRYPRCPKRALQFSMCVCVFFPSILDIKFVGRTSRGHTGGRSHRIFNPPSFCGACLDFYREKDSAIPFPVDREVEFCVLTN